MTPAWYAIYTAPLQEDRVYRALMFGREIYAWLPKRRYWIRHARRKDIKERPLFPRYIFALIQRPADFFEVRTTPGVLHFVGITGAAPTPIAGVHIDRFMELEATGAFDETREKQKTRKDALKPVLEGKLGDLAARIAAARENEAVMILLAEAGIVDGRREREAA